MDFSAEKGIMPGKKLRKAFPQGGAQNENQRQPEEPFGEFSGDNSGNGNSSGGANGPNNGDGFFN